MAFLMRRYKLPAENGYITNGLIGGMNMPTLGYNWRLVDPENAWYFEYAPLSPSMQSNSLDVMPDWGDEHKVYETGTVGIVSRGGYRWWDRQSTSDGSFKFISGLVYDCLDDTEYEFLDNLPSNITDYWQLTSLSSFTDVKTLEVVIVAEEGDLTETGHSEFNSTTYNYPTTITETQQGYSWYTNNDFAMNICQFKNSPNYDNAPSSISIMRMYNPTNETRSDIFIRLSNGKQYGPGNAARNLHGGNDTFVGDPEIVVDDDFLTYNGENVDEGYYHIKFATLSIVCDGEYVSFYVNGVLKARYLESSYLVVPPYVCRWGYLNFSNTTQTEPFQADYSGGGSCSALCVRMYDRALTADEILQNSTVDRKRYEDRGNSS